MSLKELLTKVQEKRAESRIDISTLAPGVQSTAEGLRNNAIADTARLEDEYKTLAAKKCAIVAVNGAKAKEFADLAAKTGWATFDYKALIERLAQSVIKRAGRDDFSSQEFWMLVDELNKLKLEYKLLSLPMPKIDHSKKTIFGLPCREAVLEILVSNYANALFAATCFREIGQAALNGEFVGTTLPVILYNCDGENGEVDNSFLPSPVSSVTVESEPDAAFVASILESIGPKKVKKPIKSAKNEGDKE